MCDAYLIRGAVYFSQDNYEHALADFTEAIRLDPNNGKAYKNRAATYITLGESSLGFLCTVWTKWRPLYAMNN